MVRCDILQIRLFLQEGHQALAQHAVGARACPLLRGLLLRAVPSQWKATPFGGAAGHFPPQGRGRAELPQPGPALQHSRGSVQGDSFRRQCPRGDSARRVLGFLGFSKASTLACSFLQTPHAEHRRQFSIIQSQELLAAPHRFPGDAASPGPGNPAGPSGRRRPDRSASAWPGRRWSAARPDRRP